MKDAAGDVSDIPFAEQRQDHGEQKLKIED
jgi:hypothetical protein